MHPAIEFCVIFADPTFYLEEQVQAFKSLRDKDFRVLYVPDQELSAAWQQKLQLDERFRVVPSGKASIPVKRNFCVKHLLPQTQWLAFIDDDGFPPPDWLGELKSYLAQRPQLMAFGGPSLPPPSAPWRERAVGLAIESYVGLGARARWSRPLPRPVEVKELRTCNLVINRSCFEPPDSLFDERLSIGEDVEWCRRVAPRQGITLTMFPALYIFNHSRPLFSPVFFQFFRYGSYRMKILLLEKNVPLAEWLAIVPPMGLVLLPAAALFMPKAAAALAAFYLAVVAVEGLVFGKSLREHLMRFLAIPCVHLSYGLGLLARLTGFGPVDVQTYVRSETSVD